MKLIKGADLSPDQRAAVQGVFVNWFYDATVRTFDEWVIKKAFYFTDKGELSRRHKYCTSACFAD